MVDIGTRCIQIGMHLFQKLNINSYTIKIYAWILIPFIRRGDLERIIKILFFMNQWGSISGCQGWEGLFIDLILGYNIDNKTNQCINYGGGNWMFQWLSSQLPRKNRLFLRIHSHKLSGSSKGNKNYMFKYCFLSALAPSPLTIKTLWLRPHRENRKFITKLITF